MDPLSRDRAVDGAHREAPDLDRFRKSHEYVACRGTAEFAEFETAFDTILQRIGRVHPIDPDTRIFEVGAGLGWFEVICAQRGLSCSAIEFNPVIREAALDLAQRHGAAVDIELADIEETELGRNQYDVIIATSVFEHVRHYGRGLARIYEALRPGGAFYFYSTNKFSLRSGEYPDFSLYGWFPYPVRRRIRIARQGSGIVESAGIDFNQFTYWGLRRHLESLGFSSILDRVDYLRPNDGIDRSRVKNLALHAAKALPPVRAAARAFASGNSFLCVK